MQSDIKVKITPKQMDAVYDEKHEKYNIVYYKFLGIERIGDFNAEKCSDEEWLKLADVPCIYLVVMDHEEFWYFMREEMYLSWSGVERALKMKKKVYFEDDVHI